MFWISRGNKEYLILGSELICDKGEYENKFKVSPKTVKLQGYHVASQVDNVAGLTSSERTILLRDGIQRLRNENILLRDVKHLLDINER